MSVTLTFLGAAETVTGSRHLLESDRARVLLDCGLFQGLKALRARNWQPPPLDPARLDAVVLSHAHIDHSGYLPRLVHAGFAGPVYCTPATADLLGVLLPDAAHLQEEEAAFANHHGTSRHTPALPLFTVDDAARVLRQLRTADFGAAFAPGPGVETRFTHSGHILGAGLVECRLGGRLVVFSGDLGRYDVPIMRDPDPVREADVLLLESTYGDRLHEVDDRRERLAGAVRRAADGGGWLLIPAFAVGRAQDVLFDLRQLEEAGRIPSLPMFLDSPMAIDASELLCRHPGDHKLSDAQCLALGAVARYVRSAEESKALTADPMPKIIVSASGMATGGRILHHLKRYAPDPRNTIIFAGYQAAGTRGAAMLAGADSIKIHGAYVPLRAEILNLSMLSAHADAGEILRWLKGFKQPPRMTFIVHGEPSSSDSLRRRIQDELGWACKVAEQMEKVELG